MKRVLWILLLAGAWVTGCGLSPSPDLPSGRRGWGDGSQSAPPGDGDGDILVGDGDGDLPIGEGGASARGTRATLQGGAGGLGGSESQ
jgi:hypothetical protein